MINNDTIFGRKPAAAIPKNYVKPNDQTRPRKPRQTRSDKKKDIKIRLSATDKKILQYAALKHNLSLTAFISLVVKQDLKRNREYAQVEQVKEGPFIHIVLEQEFFTIIQTMAIEFGISYRRVVHRIVADYINRTTGGPQINDWRDKAK